MGSKRGIRTPPDPPMIHKQRRRKLFLVRRASLSVLVCAQNPENIRKKMYLILNINIGGGGNTHWPPTFSLGTLPKIPKIQSLLRASLTLSLWLIMFHNVFRKKYLSLLIRIPELFFLG